MAKNQKQTEPKTKEDFTTIRIHTSAKDRLQQAWIQHQARTGKVIKFAPYMDKLSEAALRLELD